MKKQLSKLTTEELVQWEAARDEVNLRREAARLQGVRPTLDGIKIGKWTLIGTAYSVKGMVVIDAVCSCGNSGHPQICKLVTGSISCGCYRAEYLTTHGHSTAQYPGGRSKTFRSWKGMIDRCYNPNIRQFKGWGSRGITVCDRWRTFENFLADMGERPEGTSIDRINNDGNYEPGNCRWATRREQCQNKSNNSHVIHNGVRMCLSEFERMTGIRSSSVRYFQKKGLTIEQIAARSKRNFLPTQI